MSINALKDKDEVTFCFNVNFFDPDVIFHSFFLLDKDEAALTDWK